MNVSEDAATPPETHRATLADGGQPLQTIAVVWPDECESVAEGPFSGSSSDARPLLASQCASVLSLVELALLGGGFRVVNWDTVRRYGQTHQTTPEAAAAVLGVQGLVRFAALEYGEIAVPVEVARTFRQVDRQGRPHGSGAVSSRTVELRVQRALPEAVRSVPRFAITLVASVTLVPTGVLAWQFRGTVVEPSSDEGAQFETLLACRADTGCTAQQWSASGSLDVAPPADARAAREQAAARHRLLRRVLTRFALGLSEARLRDHCSGAASTCGAATTSVAPINPRAPAEPGQHTEG